MTCIEKCKPIDISVGDGESNGQITSIEYELYIYSIKIES